MGIVCTNDKQRLTKECLYISLVQLLKKKDLQDITVTELCAKAGISRMAFYRNYSVAADILEEHIEYDLCGGDLDEEYSKEVGLEKLWTDYYVYLKLNSGFVKLLVGSNYSYMFHKATDKMVSKFSHLMLREDLESYIQAVVVASVVALVTEWMKNDMDRSCDEMAALTIRLVNTITGCEG